LLVIDLAETSVSDVTAATLASIPNLSSINLAGTRVTDAGIARLRFPEAESVLIIGDGQVSEAAIQALQSKYPNCRVEKIANKKKIGAR